MKLGLRIIESSSLNRLDDFVKVAIRDFEARGGARVQFRCEGEMELGGKI